MRRLLYISIITAALSALASCAGREKAFTTRVDAPIYPDYMDVTIPCNIAPLNFDYTVEGAGKCITTFEWDGGSESFKGARVRWNMKKWRRMLSEAVGNDIRVTSSALDTSWTIHVSADSIDYGLNYRLIEPGYEVYSKMGIYERCLSNFDERPLIENTVFDGCVNCHAYNRGDPSKFSLHIRGEHGATLLQLEDGMDAYNTKTDHTLGFCVYPYWHPSGRYIVYSTNATRQGFHVSSEKLIEVFDSASDLQVYDTESNELITAPSVKIDSLWETFPSFSPDGCTIYFCRALQKPIPDGLTNVRYNLYKVSFDPVTGTIGENVNLLVDAESEGKSISFPKPSYDGRYLMYTLLDYGQFSIWHHEADLWLLDLETGERRCLDTVNSPDTESYHNFSSTSRWFVFSSRRDDGLFTRPYFSHIDEDGAVTKPFMLPQENPSEFYGGRFLSYNVPEFVTGPVQFNKNKAQKLINSDRRTDFSFRR